MTSWRCAFAAMLSLTAGLVGQAGRDASPVPPGTAVARGPWFAVHWHGGDPERAADRAAAGLSQLAGLGDKVAHWFRVKPDSIRPKQPLEVHLYREFEDWAAAERRLTKGRFAANQAFSHHETKTSHVALQPVVSDAVLEDGLPLLTRRVLRHEATHLAIYAMSRSFRFHPTWFAEGLPLYLATRGTVECEADRRTELDVEYSTTLHRIRELLADDALPAVENILAGKLGDLGIYQRYAVYERFFEFLVDRDLAAVRSLMRKTRRLPPSPAAARAINTDAGKLAGANADRRFREFCQAGRPRWRQAYRMLDASGTPWVQAAFPTTNAMALRLAPSPPGAYRVEVELRVRPGRGRQMNLLLEHTKAHGFVSVAFVAGIGVTVLRFDANGGGWNRIGSVRQPDLIAIDRKSEFRIRVGAPQEGERPLSIEQNGEVLGTFVVPAGGPKGTYGVGVQAGTVGEWHRVQIVQE